MNMKTLPVATPAKLGDAEIRRLLIALNVHGRMMRSAICRLGLEPELWCRARPKKPAVAARLAAELGVPKRQMAYALDQAAAARMIADREEKRAASAGFKILTRVDGDYPRALLDHPLPPPVLYCRGTLPNGPAVGMVGSRRCDGYGREVADHLAGLLARSGVTVVSGFALGIDQAAHRGAVDAGGPTVAVLGCGLDIDYPRHSARLAEQIASHGALVSEFPLGREPRNWHFPIRNRVIAALASAMIVVQAKPRSGSLITAHAALELGRDVFAVPGRIFDELSQGTNGLLVDGAAPLTCVEDVLEPLGLAPAPRIVGPSMAHDPTPSLPGEPATEARPLPKGFAGTVVEALPVGGAGRTVEDLSAELEVTVDRLLGALLELELGGWIHRLPGPLYSR